MNVKKIGWQIPVGLVLVLASVALYVMHYYVFRDSHHIWIYMVGDLAFVPVEVLIVTLIIHSLLKSREKQAMLGKLNMVIGSFFSEVGNDLLRRLSSFNCCAGECRDILSISGRWSAGEFARAMARFSEIKCSMAGEGGDLPELKEFLQEHRSAVLDLLENPNLLEHDMFTDMLWAVTHLTEELAARESVTGLPEKDLEHLVGDMKRAFERVVVVWLHYMKHLKSEYPYLFSLAVRMNPFNPDASATITE